MLEILEFTGETVKVELALYIIENAIVLENIIFDTRNPVLIGTQWEFKENKYRKMGSHLNDLVIFFIIARRVS